MIAIERDMRRSLRTAVERAHKYNRHVMRREDNDGSIGQSGAARDRVARAKEPLQASRSCRWSALARASSSTTRSAR